MADPQPRRRAQQQRAKNAADDAVKRRALIFVPGMDLGLGPAKTIAGVATRIQEACDLAAETAAATYSVHWHEAAIKAEASSREPAATILRHDGEDRTPVIDVFEYRWSTPLTKRWSDQSAKMRLVRGGLVLLQAPTFVRFFRTGVRKTPKAEAQFLLAIFFLAVVLFYTLTLVTAAGFALSDLRGDAANGDRPVPEVTPSPGGGDENGADTAPEPPQNEEDGRSIVSRIERAAARVRALFLSPVGQAAVLAFASVQALFVSPQFRTRLGTIGTVLLAARNYLSLGDARPEATHGLVKTLEALAERDKYVDFSIVAYSFGAVVAIDTLFPTTAAPERALASVSKLVTIGAPYDFVKAVNPTWHKGRHARTGTPGEWLNVYAPIDILGSNFRDDHQDDEPTVGFTVQGGTTALKPDHNSPWELGVLQNRATLFEFYAFTSHGMYWGKDDTTERNVFTPVVEFLYDGTPVLS